MKVKYVDIKDYVLYITSISRYKVYRYTYVYVYTSIHM